MAAAVNNASTTAAPSVADRIRDLVRNKNHAAVVALVEQNPAAGVDEPALFYHGGIAAYELGDLDTAEHFYKRQICLDPGGNGYRFLYKVHRDRTPKRPNPTLLYKALAISPSSQVIRSMLDAALRDPASAEPTSTRTEQSEGVDGGVNRWLLAAFLPVLLVFLSLVAGYISTVGQPLWWKVGAVLAGLFLPIILLEAYAFARLTGESGQLKAPARRLQQESNSYIGQITEEDGGDGKSFRRRSFAAALTPHPFLSYVNKPPENRDHPYYPNNYGLFNRSYPYERDPDSFHVLVTGGSVATQFAQMNRFGPRYLEEALNRLYRPPKGKQFLVFNGALGGWRYPQQVSISAMTASAMDAVVTLDGYNEASTMLRDGVLLEHPGSKFMLANPGLDNGYERMIGDWISAWIYEKSRRYWWFRNSNYYCMVSQKLRQAISGMLDAGNEKSYLISIFEMPKLGDDRRSEWATRRYTDYIRFLHGACKQVGMLSAHFLQPIPGLGKTLTEQEKSYPNPLGEGAAGLFTKMERALADMAAKERIPTASLINVFQDQTETIYSDWPHCALDRQTGESEGYRLIAEAVAIELGRMWGLAKRATKA
ncbi:MAG: hypothetical protein HQ481_01875 [Alphaproteobacteria bacterium]|nr:hypothetical protein [Alphaproteobacteria bacterium]